MDSIRNFRDVRIVESKSLTINLENGVVEKPKYEFFKSKAFRVLKNGFWGYCYGEFDEKEGFEIAERNACDSHDSEVVSLSYRGKYELKPKIDFEDISIEEKVNFLREVENVLKSFDKIVSTKVVYMENTKKIEYRDSCGCEVSYTVPRTGVIIQAVAKDGVLQFYSKRIMKPAGYECLDGAFECAEEVVSVLKELLKAKLPPSGEMNVLMDSELAGVFIHEAFGHAVEADHVLQGASVLSGMIGKKLAGENVNVFDDPTMKEFGFYPFDDEGVKAERKALIRDGVLINYLHSRETAAKLGGKAGNGRAQATMEPIVRMSNTYIDAGDYTFEELLEETKNGVYLLGTRGGETNPATGYFQFNAQYGYVVEKGEIKYPIRDVSLSGNTLEILKEIKLGRDLEFNPGFCGKAGQLVPVSDGAPHSLVKAKVGGA